MNSLIETSLCSSGIDPSLRSTDSRGDTALDISMQISVHEQHHSTRCNGSFGPRSFDQGKSAHATATTGALTGHRPSRSPDPFPFVGLGLLWCWMSRPQLLGRGSGLLIGLPAWLSIALWYLLLGRNLGKS